MAFGTNGTALIAKTTEGEGIKVVAISMLILDVVIMLPTSETTPFALTIGNKHLPYKNVFEWMITTQRMRFGFFHPLPLYDHHPFPSSTNFVCIIG
jgi:hypothetical protein